MTEPLPELRPLDDLILETHDALHVLIAGIEARGPWPSELCQAVFGSLDVALSLFEVFYDHFAEPEAIA